METRTRGPKMVTYLTDRQFPMVDGMCKIFAVHVYDGNNYSVKEFRTLDDAASYAHTRKLRKNNYLNNVHADVVMAMTKDGCNFKTFKFTSLSF